MTMCPQASPLHQLRPLCYNCSPVVPIRPMKRNAERKKRSKAQVRCAETRNLYVRNGVSEPTSSEPALSELVCKCVTHIHARIILSLSHSHSPSNVGGSPCRCASWRRWRCRSTSTRCCAQREYAILSFSASQPRRVPGARRG